MSNEELQQAPEQTPDAPPQDAAPQEQAAPIKVDMSKSTPIGQQQQAAPIKVDMSKSTPIATPSGVVPTTSRDVADKAFAGAGPTSMSARPNDFHSWLQDVQGDVKNGTHSTWVGSMLSKFGAKGTEYGVAPGAAKMMPGVSALTGAPAALEGAIDVKRAVAPTLTDIAHGVNPVSAAAAHGEDAKKLEIAANKTVAGTFEALGPAAMLQPEALAVITPAMAAQQMAVKAAAAMGADPDTQEMVGNVAAIVAGRQVHEALNPVIERFGVAVNKNTAAETEYTNRSRNLETSRGQAAEVHQRALDAAQAEADGKGTPQQTDAARQLANEAAKNVGDAQKAFDQASESRADAKIELEKLHRRITSADEKAKAAEYERTASDSKKAKDLIEQVVPKNKGTNRYSDEDLDRALAHTEAAKAGGTKITDLPAMYSAIEEGRDGIENNLFEKAEPYKDEQVVSEPAGTKPEDSLSPKNIAVQKLMEMAKVDSNFDNAAKTLDKFPTAANPTVGETIELITKLNNYQRGAMKGANNWDINNMIETNPEFAARFFMLEAARDALHNNLEGHGIENSREARSETASLARVRDAVGAQIRANRGDVAVRGTGGQSKLGSLVAKLTRKGGAVAGAVVGGEAGGVHGAMVGAGIGEAAADPLADFFSPRAKTRNQLIEKAMKYKGTDRKPTKITGEGSPAIPKPPTPTPVAAPEPIDLTPRENEDLHAELIANSSDPDAATLSYQELEDDFKKDVAAIKKNGGKLEGDMKRINLQIEKADAADRKIHAAAAKTSLPAAEGPKSESDIISEADQRATDGEPTKLNPTLVSLGRSDESALVSHSVAMKAHSPATEITGTKVSSNDAHIHEVAHAAMDAVDEPTGIEIRSDKHPSMPKGSGAAYVYDTSSIVDKNGIVDPEKLLSQIDKRVNQKLAGPVSHEVFGGMTKDEAMSHPATRTDVSGARTAVRTAYPDWTPSQVEDYIDAQYEATRKFLTQPHIADRIKANAAVREDGLHESLHMSRGRMMQFQRDILEAHNEHEGTDSGPDSGGTGEGGEKDARPAGDGAEEKDTGGSESGRGQVVRGSDGEGETADRVEKSEIKKTPSVPPERSTGDAADDAAIKEGGGVPGGRMEFDKDNHVRMFHDPESGTTLGFSPKETVTPEATA
jgi:hypothetical protein